MEQTIIRLIAAGKGKALIDQFRQVMEEFVHREDQLLSERIAASEGAVRQAKVMAWAGPGFGLGLALLVGVVLSFRIGQSLRSVAEAARGLAAGDLNRRARVQSKDEIGVMARTFNAMADRLAAMVEAEHRDKQALTGRVNELVERRTREVVLLNEMGEMLQAAIHTEEAYMVISKLAGQLFPHVDGALFIINPSRNLLEAVATWGASPPGADKSIFTPTECWALRRGRAHIVENTTSDLLCQHLPEPPPNAYLCVPLVAQGEAMGVFYLSGSPDSETTGVVWTDAKRQLAITVAEHLALALANLRLRDTLRSQSIRDPLTGLFNRRYMEETLERELLRARRKQASLSILMIDIDHFKQFNDKFGHDAGDFVLQEVGKILQTGFRGEDIPCRHGGEEFASPLSETPLDDARHSSAQPRLSVQQ
jgi:GGDEF domain-containing protein/HAMP domain-containing protein